jgi:hypothetical protein
VIKVRWKDVKDIMEKMTLPQLRMLYFHTDLWFVDVPPHIEEALRK